MKNKATILFIFFIVIVVFVIGYFLSSKQTSPIPQVKNNEKTVGSKILVFQRLEGGIIDLKDYKNEKPVVLDFWASWCPNCQRSMPVLNKLYDKYKDKIEVIGVNIQENESTIKSFVESYGINFPIVLDPDGAISRSYGVNYTNVHILIEKNGEVKKLIPGDISESDIQSLL